MIRKTGSNGGTFEGGGVSVAGVSGVDRLNDRLSAEPVLSDPPARNRGDRIHIRAAVADFSIAIEQ
jgi:hypothetical protein